MGGLGNCGIGVGAGAAALDAPHSKQGGANSNSNSNRSIPFLNFYGLKTVLKNINVSTNSNKNLNDRDKHGKEQRADTIQTLFERHSTVFPTFELFFSGELTGTIDLREFVQKNSVLSAREKFYAYHEQLVQSGSIAYNASEASRTEINTKSEQAGAVSLSPSGGQMAIGKMRSAAGLTGIHYTQAVSSMLGLSNGNAGKHTHNTGAAGVQAHAAASLL